MYVLYTVIIITKDMNETDIVNQQCEWNLRSNLGRI